MRGHSVAGLVEALCYKSERNVAPMGKKKMGTIFSRKTRTKKDHFGIHGRRTKNDIKMELKKSGVRMWTKST
jgi:hypothetical protein